MASHAIRSRTGVTTVCPAGWWLDGLGTALQKVRGKKRRDETGSVHPLSASPNPKFRPCSPHPTAKCESAPSFFDHPIAGVVAVDVPFAALGKSVFDPVAKAPPGYCAGTLAGREGCPCSTSTDCRQVPGYSVVCTLDDGVDAQYAELVQRDHVVDAKEVVEGVCTSSAKMSYSALADHNGDVM